MATHDPLLRAGSPNEPLTHHKTDILDLPTDVLSNVFDCFRDGWTMAKGSVQWTYIDHRGNVNSNADHQTVCSLRLVCRLFHDLASSLLCPVIRVQLDEASLDRVNKISHSPRLAATVYGIQVVLHYRPKELAADLSQYTACRQQELEEMVRSCDYYAETWFLGGHDHDDETICPLPYQQYEKGISKYKAICSAWSKAVGATKDSSENEVVDQDVEDENEEGDVDWWDEDDENNDDDNSLEYQRILLEGYEAYQKKHEEQFRLIADGSFVNDLAASMSRMIHANSLGFIDKIEHIPDPYLEDPTLLSTNMEELRQLMIKPHDWATIEELEGAPELLPAKLLSELPIAIHKAGVKLRDVNIGCFPVRKNHSMVCPNRQDPSNPAWSDLRAACQSISRFEFGSGSMNSRPLRYDYLPADQQRAMDQYLRAMLTGQSLETLRLNFHAFGINDGRGRGGPHRIGKMLEGVVLPRISSLAIGGGVAINQSELEKFCEGLGYGLTYLYWYTMELSSGSWAGALDILRNRVGTRALEGRCKVYASGLTGGEFGKPEPDNVRSQWDLKTWVKKSGSSVVVMSMDYVSGLNGIGNPLRKDED